jgi:hypothetical protein
VRIYEIELLGDGALAANVVASVPDTRLLESGPGRPAVEITGDEEGAAALLRALVVAG